MAPGGPPSAAPAVAAMSQCRATQYVEEEVIAPHEREAPAVAIAPVWYWAVECTAAIGPGLAFRLGAMYVGPRLIHRAFALFCE